MTPFSSNMSIYLLVLFMGISELRALKFPNERASAIRSCCNLNVLRKSLVHHTNKNGPEDLISENIRYLDINERGYRVGEKPDSGILLAAKNFAKEFGYILLSVLQNKENKQSDSNGQQEQSLPGSLGFKLSNKAVAEAERIRIASGKGVDDVHPIAQILYDVGCYCIDEYFDERPIPRFWLLETIARIPYFSFVSMLHLYESFGWLRQPSMRKVHNAEEWNELHHLLIMESLGGDKEWKDRFIGYHAAIVYYWLIIAVYVLSPRIAYQCMELIECHAADTYATFLRENAATLRNLPPPNVARSYYLSEDLYFFDDFQVNTKPGTRRPPCDNMYDVFKNILDDETEHISTMQACQEYCLSGNSAVISPHLDNSCSIFSSSSNGGSDVVGGDDSSAGTSSDKGGTTTTTSRTSAKTTYSSSARMNTVGDAVPDLPLLATNDTNPRDDRPVAIRRSSTNSDTTTGTGAGTGTGGGGSSTITTNTSSGFGTNSSTYGSTADSGRTSDGSGSSSAVQGQVPGAGTSDADSNREAWVRWANDVNDDADPMANR